MFYVIFLYIFYCKDIGNETCVAEDWYAGVDCRLLNANRISCIRLDTFIDLGNLNLLWVSLCLSVCPVLPYYLCLCVCLLTVYSALKLPMAWTVKVTSFCVFCNRCTDCSVVKNSVTDEVICILFITLRFSWLVCCFCASSVVQCCGFFCIFSLYRLLLIVL